MTTDCAGHCQKQRTVRVIRFQCRQHDEDEAMDLEDFDEIQKLQNQGINAGDIKKLKEAGIHTIQGLQMMPKRVRLHLADWSCFLIRTSRLLQYSDMCFNSEENNAGKSLIRPCDTESQQCQGAIRCQGGQDLDSSSCSGTSLKLDQCAYTQS